MKENVDEKGNASVKLSKTTHERLKRILKEQKGGGSDIKNTLNKIVKCFVAKEELLQKYSPPLHIVTFEGSSMYIKDIRMDTNIVEVSLCYMEKKEDGKEDEITVYCHACKSDYCIHVAFAMATPELGQLQICKWEKKVTQ